MVELMIEPWRNVSGRMNEIMRLTINSIRDELRLSGDSTEGTKVTLAERLQLRRRRNDELILPFPNDEEEDD